MNKSEHEVHLLFSFVLNNINFPLNIGEIRKTRKQVSQRAKARFDVQCGEHWEDSSVARRFLWLFFPHIHLTYPVDEDENLGQLFAEITIDGASMSFSTVFGGVSLADLELGTSARFEELVQRIDYLTGKEIAEGSDGKAINHEGAWSLNKRFADEIEAYRMHLNTVDQLRFGDEKITWEEFSGGTDFDYAAGITEGGEYGRFNLKKGLFYQEPYIVLMTEKEGTDTNLSRFFGREGREKLLIEESDKFSIWADPVKAFVSFTDPDCRDEISKVLHRALFLLRTKAHFCMLWDVKIQRLYKELNEILKGIAEKESGFHHKMKRLTDLSLVLAEYSSEIFGSFVWRYSAFLSSAKRYLGDLYDGLDEVMTTSTKAMDLRQSVDEIRTQIEFVGNIARDRIAVASASRLLGGSDPAEQ